MIVVVGVMVVVLTIRRGGVEGFIIFGLWTRPNPVPVNPQKSDHKLRLPLPSTQLAACAGALCDAHILEAITRNCRGKPQ